MMNSIKFPEMFTRHATNTVSDYDATLQNLKLLITSEEGTLFGDPYYGIKLRKLAYNQNYSELWNDIAADQIYTKIANFIPQLYVKREDIYVNSSTPGKININIKATNREDFQTNMYNIVLLNTKA